MYGPTSPTATTLERGFEEAVERLGGLDVLVVSHGIGRRVPALDHDLSDWDDVLRTNLTSVFELCRLAGRIMVPQGRGKIVTVASMLSFSGGLNVSSYAASKGGVGQLTKALANEWAPHGVNVNAIAPGLLQDGADGRHLARRPRTERADPRAAPGRPLGRAGRPRGRDRLPRLARVGLRARDRPAGRRRLAEPLVEAHGLVDLRVRDRLRRRGDRDRPRQRGAARRPRRRHGRRRLPRGARRLPAQPGAQGAVPRERRRLLSAR